MPFIKKFLKRLVLFIIIPILLIVSILFLFKESILLKMGDYLVLEDSLVHCRVAFVLSGGPIERGVVAATLLKAKHCDTVICTGEIVPEIVNLVNKPFTEGQLTQLVLLKEGVDSNKIQLMNTGTSTYEEANAILIYCQQRKIQSFIVVSSKFHTRRVRKIFDKFEISKDFKIIIRGGASVSFMENNWWRDEDGLLFVNNEYLKLLYYWYKYPKQ